MILNKQTKEKIYKVVDNKPFFNIFGYVNIKKLRFDLSINKNISD